MLFRATVYRAHEPAMFDDLMEIIIMAKDEVAAKKILLTTRGWKRHMPVEIEQYNLREALTEFYKLPVVKQNLLLNKGYLYV